MPKRKTVGPDHDDEVKASPQFPRGAGGYGDDYELQSVNPLFRPHPDDEVVIEVTDPKPKQKPFPRLYVLIDSKDNSPVGQPHMRERDAYQEKEEFANAHITVSVVIYEPLLGGSSITCW